MRCKYSGILVGSSVDMFFHLKHCEIYIEFNIFLFCTLYSLLTSTDVTISGILDSLVIGFLNGKEPSLECDQQLFSASHRLVKRAQCIARKLAAGSNSLYIILHNIDGIGLRNAVAQSSLATLVVYGMVDNVRRIRLVASMDHVNAAAFLWDARTNAGFSWVSKNQLFHIFCSRSFFRYLSDLLTSPHDC